MERSESSERAILNLAVKIDEVICNSNIPYETLAKVGYKLANRIGTDEANGFKEDIENRLIQESKLAAELRSYQNKEDGNEDKIQIICSDLTWNERGIVKDILELIVLA